MVVAPTFLTGDGIHKDVDGDSQQEHQREIRGI